MPHQNSRCPVESACLGRRGFIRSAAAGIVTVSLTDVFPNSAQGQALQQVLMTSYEKKSIAKVSDLADHTPVEFSFPSDDLHSRSLLVKLGQTAGGGVGPEQDIVAFNSYCTHMGGDLIDGYLSEHRMLGCSEHLTTFDLTRHGMVVAGHATQWLPQIVLEVNDDQIYAKAIIGLIYGYHQNPQAGE